MNIEIRKLNNNLIEDYLTFFDQTPHSEMPDDEECKCYCVWWCSDNQTEEIFNEFLSTKEKRRAYARKAIENNLIQGYLAYYNNQVVGWCNTNTKKDCCNCFCWKNFMKEIKINNEQLIKSVFCFTVKPSMRGKGIATALLKRICEDAEIEGFDYVEAYPNKTFQNEAEDFMGPEAMFKKLGFVKTYETSNKIVYKKG